MSNDYGTPVYGTPHGAASVVGQGDMRGDGSPQVGTTKTTTTDEMRYHGDHGGETCPTELTVQPRGRVPFRRNRVISVLRVTRVNSVSSVVALFVGSTAVVWLCCHAVTAQQHSSHATPALTMEVLQRPIGS